MEKKYDIVTRLRQQAKEIANEGIYGWGNTMTDAANLIEALRSLLDGLAAEERERVEQEVHPTNL